MLGVVFILLLLSFDQTQDVFTLPELTFSEPGWLIFLKKSQAILMVIGLLNLLVLSLYVLLLW